MKYTTLDTTVKGILLQKGYPIHFYVEFLVLAQRCFEEIYFDTIGNIRSLKIPVNAFGEATLPDDFMDWVKIGYENGQFIKPLIRRPGFNRLNYYTINGIIATTGNLAAGSGYTDGVYTNVPLTGGFGTLATANITVTGGVVTAFTPVTPGQDYYTNDVLSCLNTNIGGTGSGFSITVLTITQSGQADYPDIWQHFDKFYHNGYTIHYNDKLEFTGRYYGAAVNRTDTFEVVTELNKIQLHQMSCASFIVLQYISDGSTIDNATQITPYAKSTIEGWCNWKHKENGRSYGEGERDRARRLFEFEHRKLRGRQNPMSMSDFRAIIYRNSSGAPK
jgi:hypothetical protein